MQPDQRVLHSQPLLVTPARSNTRRGRGSSTLQRIALLAPRLIRAHQTANKGRMSNVYVRAAAGPGTRGREIIRE